MAILHESDEGTMHEVRKIAVGEPWGTECKVDRQNEYSIHMEIRTLCARRMFKEKLVVLPYISHMLFLIDIFDILPFWELP